MNEQWKPIPGWPEYAVSSLGRIQGLTIACCTYAGKILKPVIRRRYLYVHLHSQHGQRKYFIHRLVLLAFIGTPSATQECNHINGKKFDNRLCNLEYVTKSENMLHAIRLGLANPIPPPVRRGEANSRCIITSTIAQAILDAPRGYGTGRALAREFGITEYHVSLIRTNACWKHLKHPKQFMNSHSQIHPSIIQTILQSPTGHGTTKALSEKFNIHVSTIYRIRHHRTWKTTQ